jgi:glycosyltransferase involved in cell wall biosynthesis
MPASDMSARSAPRALFVTPAAFNHITGGGITFSALFQGWPTDRLATVHSDTVPTADDVCQRYYRLSPAEITRWPRFRTSSENNAPVPDIATPPNISSGLRTAKRWIAGNGWPDTGHLTPELESWIGDFKPQILYTILGTIGMMELVDVIRRRFALPLVVHFMDDWPSHLYRGGLLSFAARLRMNIFIRRLVGAATARMAICDAMAEAFEKRYGAPFSVHHNPVDMTAVTGWIGEAMPAKGGPGTENALRVLYVGSIFDNAQAQSLIDIARAVASLAQGGRAIRFDLHCPLHLAERFRASIEIAPNVRLHDTIADDACFFGTIAAADILVLPVNFDADTVRLVRYSMPTKLPAYMASGTATLVYGPPGVAQVEYARRQGWGYILDRQGVDGVTEALTQLADDETLRTELAARAGALAAERHDATLVRSAFQASLIKAAETSIPRGAE